MQPLEQHAEPVALALDMPERAPKLPPHAVEALRERAELVAELVAHGTLEVAGGNRLRSGRQPAQPQRDQLREQQSDEHADQPGDHACLQRLVVQDPDSSCDIGSAAHRDDRRPAGVRSGAPTTTMPPFDVINARRCPELAALSAAACSEGAGAKRVRAGAFASRCPSLLYT